MKPGANKNDALSMVNEPGDQYASPSTDLLKAALKRTHLERFLFATRLYKIQQTFNKAAITHKPDLLK